MIGAKGGRPRKTVRSHRRKKEGEQDTSIKLCVMATEAAGTGTSVELHVDPTKTTIRQLKEMMSEQMSHAEVPEASISVDFIGLCHRGRMLKDDFLVGVYHLKEGDEVFLRIKGFGRSGQADRFPFCTEPTPEPEAMTLNEIKTALREGSIFRRALTFEQLVETLQVTFCGGQQLSTNYNMHKHTYRYTSKKQPAPTA